MKKTFFDSLQNLDLSITPKKKHQLAPHTYMKVGGPAEYFVIATNLKELEKTYLLAHQYNQPVFILGGGSNIIISDKGIKGLVILNKASQILVKGTTIITESGALTNTVVHQAIDNSLQGLEFFLGVPGTIGGAIYNNAHYKNELIGNFVKTVKTINPESKPSTYSQSQLGFSYDYSRFHSHTELILSVTFRLKKGNKSALKAKSTDFLKMRSESQPLSLPSSGCLFKNPSKEEISQLNLPPTRLSAGYLIDSAGLKGKQIGQIQISPKHANFFVNLGEGKAQDIKKLMKLTQKKVFQKFGIKLEPEVFFIGLE